MRWELARIVVIVVVDCDASIEEGGERRAIRVGRDVECRDGVAACGRDALKQQDVTLDARDEHRLARRIEAQLKQRADAVSVAVERVEMAHAEIRDLKARNES